MYMEISRRFLSAAAIPFFFLPISVSFASSKIVVVEAHYLMADGDTLAGAEEKVLQRAQRKAVEEAGIYLEASFHDIARESVGHSSQASSLEIRTIAAAIAETEVLESRRSFEQDRPSFFIRIRATVNLSSLAEAIKRHQSDQELAQHFRQLQQENQQLRAQLRQLQQQPVGVRMLAIEPSEKSDAHQRARTVLDRAIHAQSLRDKIQLSTDASQLDDRYVDPLIVRGQTYIRLISLAFAEQAPASTYAAYLENARADFDRAITLDEKNLWAWIGKGDALSWLQQQEEAVAAYEQALDIDPFADIARQRLISLYTTQARRHADAKRWQQALSTLKKLLNAQTPDSWIPYQKEAYLLRSDIYVKLNQPDLALNDLSTVIQVDPTNTNALLVRAKLYRDRLQGRLAKDDLERACVLGSIGACEQLP